MIRATKMFGDLLSDLRSTSKPNEKLDTLKHYECDLLFDLLCAAYEPLRVFHLNIKEDDVPPPGTEDLTEVGGVVEVLSFCESSNSNKQNRELVVDFLKKLNIGSQELFVNTLNKNWKAGLGAKLILRAYPGLISQFKVQLANTYKPDNKQHNSVKEWLVSYKLDGVRCVALRESSDKYYDNGCWTLYSRQGKEFLTAEHLKPQLELVYQELGLSFFDGELYRHGLKFEEIQGLVTGFTRGQSPELEYHIFVGGDAKKFIATADPKHVVPINLDNKTGVKDIKSVTLGLLNSLNIYNKLEEAFDLGYEGIMLRDPNNLYDYKRSNALLKLKQSLYNMEGGEIISDCIVIDIEYKEDFPIIDNGELLFKKLLHKIWVQQDNGIKCKVGSGFDLKFRERYTENPWDLLGAKIEVKHQQWGSNGRMRFPRFYRIREDL